MLNLRITSYSKIWKTKFSLAELVSTYSTSTQPVVQNTKEHYDKQLKDFETLKNITKKVRTKKPQKPPFAKNLFLGIFDTDILTYPELEKESVENLEKDYTSLRKLMNRKHMVECNSLSDKNFRQNLSDHKAIGIQASQFLDGRECNTTESQKFLEALSEHHLRDGIVTNEQLGIQTFVKFASDELKKKYLYKIMKGESLTALCLSETNSVDIHSFTTKADLSQDGKTWILNGMKTWVINGVSADILIVFALSRVLKKDIITESDLTAFIVEKDFPGITVKRNDSTGVETANIIFSDTPVPTENIIGTLHEAVNMLSPLISEYRLSVAPMCITLTKKLLNRLTDTIIEKTNETNLLDKTDAVRERIGEITTTLYAMESVAYLTTGLIDNYENQNCELECVITKIFCSESALGASTICLDMVGAPAMSSAHFCNKLNTEILSYLTLHETNDSLKVIIALLGLQHAGNIWNEKITKMRNPLTYSTYALKSMWENRKNVEDNPKLDLGLHYHLHPSSQPSAQCLEYCVKRLQFTTEVLLSRYGPEVMNNHMELRRLANIIIDIYTMTACVGRSSRSYCIGLQHSNYEMVIATAFCNSAMERVKSNVNKILSGAINTNDENYRTIAKNIFKYKGYYPEHPLKVNF